MGRPLALATIVLAALATAGCAAETSSAEPPSATSTTPPTPSSSATPGEPVSPASQPTIPFDGDCSAVLTDQQLDDLLGAGWMRYEEKLREWTPERVIPPDLSSLGTIGGLECRWAAADGSALGEPQLLAVLVAPSSDIPAAFTADLSEPRCDAQYDATNCRLAREYDGVWIMARAGYTFEETPVALLESTVEAARSTVGSAFDGVAAASQPSWWPLPSCEELGDEMSLEELIGEDYRNGYYEGDEQPEQILLAATGAELTCPWFSSSATAVPDGVFRIVSLQLAPGAGWRWEAIADAAGGQTIAVEGAADARTFGASAEDNNVVFATDGVNVLAAYGPDRDVAGELASRALSVLAG